MTEISILTVRHSVTALHRAHRDVADSSCLHSSRHARPRQYHTRVSTFRKLADANMMVGMALQLTVQVNKLHFGATCSAFNEFCVDPFDDFIIAVSIKKVTQFFVSNT